MKKKKKRRTKYDTHVEPRLLEVEAWARDGLSDEQIAKNLGIAYSTFRLYRDANSAMSAALKKGKEVVDIEVENNLFKLCMGFEVEEERTEIEEVDGLIKRKKVIHKKVIPPNVAAIIWWLKNRKPDKWKDKPVYTSDETLEMLDNVLSKITSAF